MISPSLLVSLASAARHLLEPHDVDRMLMPAIADALVESADRPSLRDLTSLLSQVIRIIALASWHRMISAAQSSSWAPLFAATVAGVAGAVGLQNTGRGSLSHAQLIFVVIGLVIAAAIVLLPSRLARLPGATALLLATLALVLVPWLGFSYEGVHRWVRLGPIAVYVAILALPVFAVFLARIADTWRRPAVVSLVIVTTALLLAQPDAPSAVVYCVVASAACWRSRSRVPVLAASIAGATAAVLLNAPLPSVEHVEGAHRLLAARGPLWLGAALCGLAGLLVLAARGWWMLRRQTHPSARVFERQAAAAAAGLAALVIVPRLLGDGGTPLMSYGGSAVVAAYALAAVVIRSNRRALGVMAE